MPGKQLTLFDEENEVVKCKFCDIISGKIASNVVYSDEHFIAFLDHKPLFKGHTLLVPRKHFENIYEMDEETSSKLMHEVQLISRAVEIATSSDGTFIAINNKVSQSVPHVHVHIVPRKQKDGLKGFFWPRQEYGEGEDREYANKIREQIEKISSTR
ncbi:HIT family protein [Thermoplasma volcanium]|uniref:HIT family protein n=1 Tax=Thermoplasma volcanium TaxID=50339 RepID=UPI000AA05732|nr:HIT family protein [Thermoplasma volcanium]